MAINDSNAPRSIPASGEVSPGNTNADRSINLLKNIKTETNRAQSDTSLNALRNWFRTYIGGTGNFDNTGNSETQVNLSDWHDTSILGIGIQTTNETSSTYGTNNDAKITLQGFFSEKIKYLFVINYGRGALTVIKTSLHGNSVTYTGFDGGGENYTIRVIAYNNNNESASPDAFFIFTPGYNDAAIVRGVNETGINSFGTSNNPINFTYPGGTGRGETSDPLFLLIGKDDPAGRVYGPNYTYP